MCKINGKQNPADLFTKYLSRDETIRHVAVLGFRLIDHKGKTFGYNYNLSTETRIQKILKIQITNMKTMIDGSNT